MFESLYSASGPMLYRQPEVSKFYNSNHVQVVVACLIAANFLTNIIEKEIDPHGVNHAEVFGAFELFYNICFTVELFVNLYAHWWRVFWKSNWNVFDVVVVIIGVVNTLELPLPPSFSMLRMVRAFRVFRLFKRVPSLNKIIVTIFRAIPGVANAFLILAIVMSIYAILAVEFYHEIGNDCKEPGGDSTMKTGRGYCAGNEYFGTFTKSLYTFFQVLTGESWSEAVARPAIWFFYDTPIKAVGGGLFFVSYILITAFVLTNVVVAVLLDKMVDPEIAEAAAAMHPDDPSHEDDEGAEASAELIGEDSPCQKDWQQTDSKSSQTPIPANADDLKKLLLSVTGQVDAMMGDSEKVSSELGFFRTDMSSMQMQLSTILQCLHGRGDSL